MMNVLFVRPNDKKSIYGSLAPSISAIEPPVWALVLAAYLREQGFAVGCLDAEVTNEDPIVSATRIEAEDPQLVCVVTLGSNLSASTWKMAGTRVLIEEIRRINPNRRIILWGLHPSALPEQSLREEKVDFVCQGEGFQTLALLLRSLQDERISRADIPGLWFYDNENAVKINHGPVAAIMENLDSLPLPAWDLVPVSKYRAHNWHCFEDLSQRSPYATIYTSLGCPFHCSFCALHTLFGSSSVRFRSPENVMDEIDLLVKEYGVRNIKILDECFVLKPSHVEEICDRIIEAGYNLNIWAYARIDTVNANLLKKLKSAGFHWLAFGIESGSSGALAGVQKNGYDRARIRRVVAETQASGIHVVGNFMFGLPADTQQSMEETLDFAMELNCEYTNFYVTMAYPGSELYKHAINENVRLPNSWIGYSQYSDETIGLPTTALTSEEVLRFRDFAFTHFHTSSTYLDMLTIKFGTEVAEHMRDIAAKPLKRKNI